MLLRIILFSFKIYLFVKVSKGNGSSVVVKVVNSPNFVKPLPPKSGAPVNRNQVNCFIFEAILKCPSVSTLKENMIFVKIPYT